MVLMLFNYKSAGPVHERSRAQLQMASSPSAPGRLQTPSPARTGTVATI